MKEKVTTKVDRCGNSQADWRRQEMRVVKSNRIT